MKIYTKTGDEGQTGLYGGKRVFKDDVRIEAYGEVDELNCCLGWCCTLAPADVAAVLNRIQHELFSAGAELARGESTAAGPSVSEQCVGRLEQDIDRMEERLTPLREFILPGGTPAASALHLARGVCRRAERRLTTLARTPGAPVQPRLMRYFNRLGDLLFVLARVCNQHAKVPDTPWSKPDGD